LRISQPLYSTNLYATAAGSSPPEDTTYSLTSGLSNLNLYQPQQEQTQASRSTADGAYGFNDDHVQRAFQSAPYFSPEQITQPLLTKHNIYASKKFPGTTEKKERLDPSMYLHREFNLRCTDLIRL
jgi:hypothetical protein